jgi:hypothetical protein
MGSSALSTTTRSAAATAEVAYPDAHHGRVGAGDEPDAVLAMLYSLEDVGIRLYSLTRPLRYRCRTCGSSVESLVAARAAGATVETGGWICPCCFYRHVTGSDARPGRDAARVGASRGSDDRAPVSRPGSVSQARLSSGSSRRANATDAHSFTAVGREACCVFPRGR